MQYLRYLCILLPDFRDCDRPENKRCLVFLGARTGILYVNCRESVMQYDAVIVGASLAGLYSDMALAKNGWKVCILDRKSTIGIPVRCGEATGNRRELSRFIPIDESWIASDITGVALHLNDTEM